MNAWTENEFDLLETLTRRIKLMTHEQLTELSPIQDHSDSRVHPPHVRLLRADLLLTTTINARPLPMVPLIDWTPDATAPEFDSVWRRIRDDRHQASRPTRVYWAAPKTANLFGVKGGSLGSINERQNDLRLAAAYVRHHARTSRGQWHGTAFAVKRFTSPVPVDAVIVEPDGVQQRAVLVARGDVQRLHEFHAACVTSATAYEVW